jgi:DNA (cytosine-5)-methyltransferase 1
MKTTVRIGSLCTGYGGLDMAVKAMFGGKLTWCADNDRHVATLLAARYEGIPNLGDIATLDWPYVGPVEIICAGFPCQDISYAGSGAGIKRGTRSGIWINIVAGIRLLAPKIVIVENVAALRRRGLDRVLGDLAALGYDAIWTSLRASDIGAAHRRERVFVLAYRPGAGDLLTAADAGCQRRAWRPASGQETSRRPPSGPQRFGPDIVPGRTALADAAGGPRNFTEPAQHPRQPDAGGSRDASDGTADSDGIAWGRYEAAIRRWETITGRPVPQPTERGTRGQTRLAAAFSEWLMGLPEGFVTGLDLPYTAQHRLLGNGVVPQQALAALRQLAGAAAKQLIDASRELDAAA